MVRGPQCAPSVSCMAMRNNWLEPCTDFYLSQAARQRLFVHAGVVARGGRAIVIPGRSQSKEQSEQFARMAYLKRPEAMERYLSRKPDVVRCSIKDRLVETLTS